MNYVQSLFNTIKNSFNFNGRSSVEEYWKAISIYYILFVAGNIIISTISEKGYIDINSLDIFAKIFQFLITIPFFGLAVRRLHDINKSGWWLFIGLTIIGLIPIIYWSLKKSDEIENKYGDIPEDANVGNFHRNIGISISLALFILTIINAYSVFNSLQNWQKEIVGDSGQESQTIFRLLNVKNKQGGIIKFSLLCNKEKDMLATISTFFVSDNYEAPVKIIDSTDSISFEVKSQDITQTKNNLKFIVINEQQNTAYVETTNSALLNFIVNEFSISVNTNEGVWKTSVDLNFPEVKQFINDCSK